MRFWFWIGLHWLADRCGHWSERMAQFAAGRAHAIRELGPM